MTTPNIPKGFADAYRTFTIHAYANRVNAEGMFVTGEPMCYAADPTMPDLAPGTACIYWDVWLPAPEGTPVPRFVGRIRFSLGEMFIVDVVDVPYLVGFDSGVPALWAAHCAS